MIKLAGLKPVMDSDSDAAMIANDNHDTANIETTEATTEYAIETPSSEEAMFMDLMATAAIEASNNLPEIESDRVAQPNVSAAATAICGEGDAQFRSKVSSPVGRKQFF